MMADYPTTTQPETSPQVQLPERWQKFLDKYHDELTVEQFRTVCNYLENKCSKLRSAMEGNLTIEDFEKAKKMDIDGDKGEGEDHPY